MNTRRWSLRATQFLFLVLLTILPPTVAEANVIMLSPGAAVVVDNTDTKCSLREAIINANANAQTHSDCSAGGGLSDQIVMVAGSTYTLPDAYSGQNGLPSITSSISITGNGATVRRDSLSCNVRVFHVSADGDLSISSLTVRRGCVQGAAGGGIYNYGGRLEVHDSTISGNSADTGGGIANIANGGVQPIVTIKNSTVSGNSADTGGGIANSEGTVYILDSTLSENFVKASGYGGGGIANSQGAVVIRNSTLSLNHVLAASGYGGGITTDPGSAVLISNSTLWNNFDNSNRAIVNSGGVVQIKSSIVGKETSGDGVCSGGIAASGVNFATDASCPGFTQKTAAALNLGPLLVNSPGATATHALDRRAGSVAIDAAGDCKDISMLTVTQDQRGVTRPQDTKCDVGAYEATGKYGMTWIHETSNSQHGTITVGCGSAPNNCDPVKGDTLCTKLRPLLCIYGGKPRSLFTVVPPGVNNSSMYNRWSGGVVATTAPLPGTSLSLANANAVCRANFGTGWRMAEFHDGEGWNFQAYGGTTGAPAVGVADRFWVYINDQPANCWN